MRYIYISLIFQFRFLMTLIVYLKDKKQMFNVTNYRIQHENYYILYYIEYKHYES